MSNVNDSIFNQPSITDTVINQQVIIVIIIKLSLYIF